MRKGEKPGMSTISARPERYTRQLDLSGRDGGDELGTVLGDTLVLGLLAYHEARDVLEK